MNGLKLLSEHKSEILNVASENGIKNVRIFGSTARGVDQSSSDIDLLVEIEEGTTLFDLIRFKQHIEDMIGKKVDVVTDQALHDHLKEHILNEAVQL